jgi:hypothetical protein
MKKASIPQPAPFKPQPAVLPPVLGAAGLASAKLTVTAPAGLVPRAMPNVPAPYQTHAARTFPPSKLASLGAPQAMQAKRVSGGPVVASAKPTPLVPTPYRPAITARALQAKLAGAGPARRTPQPPPVYRARATPQPIQRSASTVAFVRSMGQAGSGGLIQRAKPAVKPVKPRAASYAASQEKKAAKATAAALAIATQAAAAEAAQNEINAYPKFDAAASLLVARLFPKELVEFRKLCGEGGLDPSQIATQIAGGGTDDSSRKHGLKAFANGVLTAAQATYLASQYVNLKALRMDTANIVTEISNAWHQGIIEVSTDNYRDDPMQSGTVYIFKLKGTHDRILPEWHVHWAPGKTISAASFKNNRLLPARKETGDAQHMILKLIVPADSWGG